MLFPLPQPQKFSSEEDPQLSFSFSGVQNTSRAGTPVPIVYGEIFTGSVVISAAIDTNQVDSMTDEIKIIRGSKGPKTPPPPYRAPDTLHSRSFATVQDLISEGEIEGFASASKAGLTKGTTAYENASLKDVFLDGYSNTSRKCF